LESKNNEEKIKNTYIIKIDEIDHKIGFGGNSIVYHAVDKSGKPVIIKEIYPVAFDNEVAFIRERDNIKPNPFVNNAGDDINYEMLQEYLDKCKSNAKYEYKVLRETLSKSNSKDNYYSYLSSQIDDFEANGTYYSVTGEQYLEPLPDKYDSVKQVLTDTLYILIAIANLHAHGKILHLDIKPQNIMRMQIKDRHGDYILYPIDFSSAIKKDDVQNLTADKISRTATYAAPELMKFNEDDFDRTEIGEHTDVYSIGITLLKFLAPKNISDTEFSLLIKEELFDSVLNADGGILKSNAFSGFAENVKDNEVFDKLNEIIRKALLGRIPSKQKEKSNSIERYANCQEMIDDIYPLLEKIGVDADLRKYINEWRNYLDTKFDDLKDTIHEEGKGIQDTVKTVGEKVDDIKALLFRKVDIVDKILDGSVRDLLFCGYKWRVLEKQDDKALLITENIIDQLPCHTKNEEFTWALCYLREYLNGEFYNSFGSNRHKILQTHISTPSNLWYGTNGGENTEDNIFLLSTEEVLLYFGNSRFDKKRGMVFSDENDHRRRATNSVDKDKPIKWWLRSPGRKAKETAIVDEFGWIHECSSNDPDIGVRPALWINLKKSIMEQRFEVNEALESEDSVEPEKPSKVYKSSKFRRFIKGLMTFLCIINLIRVLFARPLEVEDLAIVTASNSLTGINSFCFRFLPLLIGLLFILLVIFFMFQKKLKFICFTIILCITAFVCLGVIPALTLPTFYWYNLVGIICSGIMVITGFIFLFFIYYDISEEKKINRITILFGIITIICIFVFIFCFLLTENPTKNPQYNKIAIVGVEIEKNDKTKELNNEDIININQFIFENIDEFKKPKFNSLIFDYTIICFSVIFCLLALSVVYDLVTEKRKSKLLLIICTITILNLYFPNAITNSINSIFGSTIVNELKIASTGAFRVNNWIGTKYSATGSGIWKQASDDSTYEGDFIAGSITGKGVMTDKDGNKFEGDFLFGNLYGQVKVVSYSGEILYEGEIWDKPATMDTISEYLSATEK